MSKPPMTPERLLTVVEVADRLNLSRKTIYRLIKAGELSVIRCGRSVRIPPKDLENYINDSRT